MKNDQGRPGYSESALEALCKVVELSGIEPLTPRMPF